MHLSSECQQILTPSLRVKTTVSVLVDSFCDEGFVVSLNVGLFFHDGKSLHRLHELVDIKLFVSISIVRSNELLELSFEALGLLDAAHGVFVGRQGVKNLFVGQKVVSVDVQTAEGCLKHRVVLLCL